MLALLKAHTHAAHDNNGVRTDEGCEIIRKREFAMQDAAVSGVVFLNLIDRAALPDFGGTE